MQQKRKLIEVSLPLAEINAEAAREKSIRHGHPSTLHLWWSRKPLAAARAVLWASLVDDPSSHPELYPTEAAQDAERRRLHELLSELVRWENSGNQELLEKAKAEIRKSMGDEKLVFLDPFAGGGSIPLEAMRLGLDVYAHDINPVAVLINKAMLEFPAKFADVTPVNPDGVALLGNSRPVAGLAEDIRYYGEWLRDEAFKRIGHLYPKVRLADGSEATVIAWLWARTVRCPNPACGCEMPLVASFELSKKKGREAWIEPVCESGKIRYEVWKGICPPDKKTNKLGKGAVFKCPACGTITEKKYIHDVFEDKQDSHALLTIVAEKKGERIYLPPLNEHVKIAESATPFWVPEEKMNTDCPNLVSGRGYGITFWKQLFTTRQLVALTTFSDLIENARKQAELDAIKAGLPDDGIGLAEKGRGARAYSEAIAIYLAIVVDKVADYHSSMCSWHITGEKIVHTFGRQAIPMTWSYAEANPFCSNSGSYDNMLGWVLRCANSFQISQCLAEQWDAQRDAGLRNVVFSTDPPYYDNIGYADLSDYFYIWLRKALRSYLPDLFAAIMTPKSDELVATSHKFAGDKKAAKRFFEDGMKQAFGQMWASARNDVPVTIYYAFKQSEGSAEDSETIASTGWETMLTGLIEAGFMITGTMPLRTELANRTAASGTNALASSIVLVCRKRDPAAPVATRRQFLNELRLTLGERVRELQKGNIAAVDLAQAAIGPGMEIYSRYSRVLEADGAPMNVRSALQAINAELDSFLAEQEGELDPASRFCIAIFSDVGFASMDYGAADVLARAKNISPERIASTGALTASGGRLQLVPRPNLPRIFAASASQTPKLLETAGSLADFTWLLTQYMVATLESGGGGIAACAALVRAFPGQAENCRELAYRLYRIAERKGLASEARAYNDLVSAWNQIRKDADKGFGGIAEQGVLGLD